MNKAYLFKTVKQSNDPFRWTTTSSCTKEA